MRQLLLLGFVALAVLGRAQTGVSGGLTMIKGFGIPKAYPGIHIGVEIPRDDEVSFYGRVTATLANASNETATTNVEARDPATTFPNVKQVNYNVKMNYINLEGGTRYYIGNGYDYGWSAYGGSVFMLSINSVKADFDDYDEDKYALTEGLTERGRILALNLGLNAGVKNHFMFGMLYFDMTLGYALFAIPSNQIASQGGGYLYSPLTFGFNFGFRKDLY
jgi:hypothetical protein